MGKKTYKRRRSAAKSSGTNAKDQDAVDLNNVPVVSPQKALRSGTTYNIAGMAKYQQRKGRKALIDSDSSSSESSSSSRGECKNEEGSDDELNSSDDDNNKIGSKRNVEVGNIIDTQEDHNSRPVELINMNQHASLHDETSVETELEEDNTDGNDHNYLLNLATQGRIATIAENKQLIKGVLPALFAVCKFLESDDDLVLNGTICRYFFHHLNIKPENQATWWIECRELVRKAIDTKRASIGMAIKKVFMKLKINNELPLLEDILFLRRNVKCMITFCEHFLPCVVGKKRWTLQLNQGAKVNQIATVSDEAFTLLLLENYWDYMNNMDEDEFYKPKRNQASNTNTTNVSIEENANSNNQQKKITGKWTSHWRGSKRFCGWESQGLLRFNELVQSVMEDRLNDLHFQAQYNIHLKHKREGQAKSNKSPATATVPVYRDLDSLGV